MYRSASCMTWPFCVIAILSISISNSFRTAPKSGPSVASVRNPAHASGQAPEGRVLAVLEEGTLGRGACERALGARGVSYGFQQETGKDFSGGG